MAIDDFWDDDENRAQVKSPVQQWADNFLTLFEQRLASAALLRSDEARSAMGATARIVGRIEGAAAQGRTYSLLELEKTFVGGYRPMQRIDEATRTYNAGVDDFNPSSAEIVRATFGTSPNHVAAATLIATLNEIAAIALDAEGTQNELAGAGKRMR